MAIAQQWEQRQQWQQQQRQQQQQQQQRLQNKMNAYVELYVEVSITWFHADCVSIKQKYEQRFTFPTLSAELNKMEMCR